MTSLSDPRSTDVDADALLSVVRDALVGVDAGGRITAWQGGAEALLGRTAAEAVGRPFAAIFDLDVAELHQAGERTLTAPGTAGAHRAAH